MVFCVEWIPLEKGVLPKGTSLIDQPANLGGDVDPEVLPPRIVINSKLIFGSLKIKRI